MEEVVNIVDEFKVHLLSIPGFEKFTIEDDKDQLMWNIKNNKYEIGFEVSVPRKKIIVSVYSKHKLVDTYEYTLNQFVNLMRKPGHKTETEPVVPKLKNEDTRPKIEAVVSSPVVIKRRGPATKTQANKPVTAAPKRRSRKSSTGK